MLNRKYNRILIEQHTEKGRIKALNKVIINEFERKYMGKNTDLKTREGRLNFINFLTNIGFYPGKPRTYKQVVERRKKWMNIIIGLDPTINAKFIRWIFRTYMFYHESNREHDIEHNQEKYKHLLSKFDRLKTRRKQILDLIQNNESFRTEAANIIGRGKIDKNRPDWSFGNIVNIDSYKDFGQVEQMILAIGDINIVSAVEANRFVDYIKSRPDAELIYADNEYVVYVPHTAEASYEIGYKYYLLHGYSPEKASELCLTWCTAAPPHRSHFNSYYRYGPVYFIYKSRLESGQDERGNYSKMSLTLSARAFSDACHSSEFYKVPTELQNRYNRPMSDPESMELFWDKLKNVDVAIAKHFLSTSAGQFARQVLESVFGKNPAENYRRLLEKYQHGVRVPLVYLIPRIVVCERADAPHNMLLMTIKIARFIKENAESLGSDSYTYVVSHGLREGYIDFNVQENVGTELNILDQEDVYKYYSQYGFKTQFSSTSGVHLVVRKYRITEIEKMVELATGGDSPIKIDSIFYECIIEKGEFRSCTFINCDIRGGKITSTDGEVFSLIINSNIEGGDIEYTAISGCKISENANFSKTLFLGKNEIRTDKIFNRKPEKIDNISYISHDLFYAAVEAVLLGKEKLNIKKTLESSGNIITADTKNIRGWAFDFQMKTGEIPVKASFVGSIIKGFINYFKDHSSWNGIRRSNEHIIKDMPGYYYIVNYPLDDKGYLRLAKDVVNLVANENPAFFVFALSILIETRKINIQAIRHAFSHIFSTNIVNLYSDSSSRSGHRNKAEELASALIPILTSKRASTEIKEAVLSELYERINNSDNRELNIWLSSVIERLVKGVNYHQNIRQDSVVGNWFKKIIDLIKKRKR